MIDTAGQIDRKLEELREATRAANEVLGDLKRERKALEDDLNEFRQYMQTSLHERLEEAAARELDKLREDIVAGRDRVIDGMHKTMDGYWRLLVGIDREHPDGDIAEQVKEKFADWEGRLQRLEGRRRGGRPL